MEYEDDELAARAADKALITKEVQPREIRLKRDLRSHPREPRGHGPRITEQTPLNTSMSNILAECADTELPDLFPERKWTNRKKYWRYHRNNGHDTNHYHTLKDDIEKLIGKGKFY